MIENKLGRFSYDKDSISTNKEGEITVRMRQFMSTDLTNETNEMFPDLRGSIYLIMYNIINCKSNEYKMDRIIYYDGSEKVVNDSKEREHIYNKMDYRSIPNKSPIQRFSDKLCE
ncbi:MAG: surface-adhesin E family protein [Syntrophus sp. (in: bacteria)]